MQAPKGQADWNKIWTMALREYEAAGMLRQVAVLKNFREKKETICRALHLIGDADIARIRKNTDSKGK